MIHEEDLTKEQNEFVDALEEWIDDPEQFQRVDVVLDHKYTRDYNKPQEWPDIDTIKRVCVMEGVS